MATFTVEGHFNGHVAHLTWKNGALSGDEQLATLVSSMAARFDGQLLGGIPYPSTTHDHLKSAYSAYELIQMLVKDAKITKGKLPTVPAPKEGEVY